MNLNPKPAIFLACANVQQDGGRYLRNLPKELNLLRPALEPAGSAGRCELIIRSNTSVEDIIDTFQNERYRGRIAAFHYGGHADGFQLLLESLEEVNQELAYHIPDTSVHSVSLSPDWQYILYQHIAEKMAGWDELIGRRQKVSRYELCVFPSGLGAEDAYSYAKRQIIKAFDSPVGAVQYRPGRREAVAGVHRR